MRVGYRCWLFCIKFIALSYAMPPTENELLFNNLLKTTGVHFRNVTELRDKLNNVIEMGPTRLLIVTDYDLTLTDGSGDNKPLNSFVMLTLCPSIPETFRHADTELFQIYLHTAMDTNLTIEEKSKRQTELYKHRVDGLKGVKLPTAELKDVARNASRNDLRQGVHELISWSELNDVPVLVVSAGLGDAVRTTLDVNGLLQPNVKIISNFFKTDEDDNISGWKTEVIHDFNKKDAMLRDEYSETKEGRSNAILMGDSTWDANMTDYVNFENIIKIGFLDFKQKNKFQRYLDIFDIVLENDGTMNVINAILNLVN